MNKQDVNEPWYAPPQKRSRKAAALKNEFLGKSTKKTSSIGSLLRASSSGLFCLILSLISGGFIGRILLGANSTSELTANILILIVTGALAIYLGLRQVGIAAQAVVPRNSPAGLLSPTALARRIFRGMELAEEGRGRGIPAPELALFQFVQQVRAYATEVAFQKNRMLDPNAAQRQPAILTEPTEILKRRWNEVLDSLAEFEIFLANDPDGMVKKLIAKYPTQSTDVSSIFREVAESFDSTWRRKGINIEAAIVTPLRAITNEALLRRLLVGPWRSCAYFARRGNGVVFSAKSVDGQVVARWECEGLMITDDYLKVAQDMSISVNERIERGMAAIAPDPSNPNTLQGLISFITWIDLALSCEINYAFKHTNDGFAIELKFR